MPGTDSAHRKIQLRDYQCECLEAILADYRSGVRRQFTCLPTGSGKTVIFAEFPRYFQMQNQMLVLAHRAELLEQACDKIRRANPDLKIAVEQAGRVADPACDVVVVSVPTLGRRGSKRLQRLDPNRFYLIVVDEAHHATAATDKRVLDYFGVFEKEAVIGRGEDIRSAINMSEAYVKSHLTQSVGLVARNTRWRQAPASDKQLMVLRSRKIKVPSELMKGQASHLISMLS
jgi:hypothetical protein